MASDALSTAVVVPTTALVAPCSTAEVALLIETAAFLMARFADFRTRRAVRRVARPTLRATRRVRRATFLATLRALRPSFLAALRWRTLALTARLRVVLLAFLARTLRRIRVFFAAIV
jgi:hypothetical protein